MRVHDSNYIGEIVGACNAIDEGDLGEFDGDTNFTQETWDASIYAAGA